MTGEITDSTVASISSYKTKRASVTGQVTKLKKFIDSSGNNASLRELEVKLGLLETYFKKFDDAQTNIEILDDSELESDRRSAFEDVYSDLKTRILTLMDSRATPTTSRSTSAHDSTLWCMKPKTARLPKLELTKFSGRYTDWPDFLSMFETLVDGDGELTAIEKFQHLRSCLTDFAFKTIQSLEVTTENYPKALDLLKVRFNNKRLIFQAHIRDIFNLPVVENGAVNKLRDLSDSVNSHIRALNTLGNKEEILDGLLIYLVVNKLDMKNRVKWEEETTIDALPKWKQLSSFIEKRCQTLETMDNTATTSCKQPFSSKSPRKSFKPIAHKTFIASKTTICSFCNSSDHNIYICDSFTKLSPEKRYQEAKAKKLCINCLRSGHQARNCSSHHCKHCSKRHSTLLHMGPIISQAVQQAVSPEEPVRQSTSHRNSSSLSIDNPDTVLLSKSTNKVPRTLPLQDQLERKPIIFLGTALVLVRDCYGSYVTCRALLDSCSQTHFCTDRLAQQLNLKCVKAINAIGGIGELSTISKYKTNLTIRSRLNEFTTNLEAQILPSITCNQPDKNILINNFTIPTNIELADPYFNKSQKIDLLIGAEIFFDLLSVGQIRLGNNVPLLQKTRFGWIVAGKLNPDYSKQFSFNATAPSSNCLEDLDGVESLLKSFWEIEFHENMSKGFTKEEMECEAMYQKSYKRLESGQFCVHLPFKRSPTELGDSLQLARKRFYNLESKLHRNPYIRNQYVDFINEYISLNHMTKIDTGVLNKTHFFLPHHCVTKADSTTTKLRVVFDASAKSSSGLSLNDILMVGPTIQDDLFAILTRFRMHRFAITADISKMYRCVQVQPPDDNLQLILWRKNKNEDLSIFKLNTVTYGTAPASFLAIRSMVQLASDESENFPIGSKAIKRDFYVDDLLSGADTIDEIMEIKEQTLRLLSKGGFHLRKWCSNSNDFISTIREEERENFLEFNYDQVTKTLGLIWQPNADEFHFSCPSSQMSQIVTKRSILSNIAKIYDPLGLISPVIVKAKLFMQEIWKERLHWDESLPQHLHSAWLEYSNQLSEISKLRFPRYARLPNSTLQLHGFADASQRAYGACIYLRCQNSLNEVNIRLLCAKSRVAPAKTVSIPRLELCAALLLAELMQRIRTILQLENCNTFCWSDSTITLSWIRSDACNWNTFVSNRVAKIQRLSENIHWRHIPSNLNPADLISRGVFPKELIGFSLWTTGPNFLLLEEHQWPILNELEDNLPEKRTSKSITLLVGIKREDLSVRCKFLNSFLKIVRTFAYIYRFFHNASFKGKNHRKGRLDTLEMDHGLKYIIRTIQNNEFPDEYKRLSTNQQISTTSDLMALTPFLDEFGIMRIRGRLQNSLLSFANKHPIILPKTHPFTSTVINHFHIKNMHAGPQSLLAALRMQFWPIGGKQAVKRVINKCVRCYKAQPVVMHQLQGDLPSQRVQPSRLFTTTGVDFCGPFYIRSGIRGRAPTKTYICLFICFAVKAVHLELATDLSSSAFLGVLKRFIARRGKPQTIFSDNATNFVGANNELKELQKLFLSQEHIQLVYDTCLDNGIQWKFIPPRSPHFGGLWESSIKIAKYHLRRTVGYALLSFEELHCLVCQIEAIINSRPLSPISEDPRDFDVLTPGHFLIGGPLTSTLEPDTKGLNVSRLARWQMVRYIMQSFWRRWSKEYLTTLQQRDKWQRKERNVAVGNLVLLKDDNLPPLKWSLGRVTEVIPGADGLVRVVNIKTPNGEVKRAITKICILPIEYERS